MERIITVLPEGHKIPAKTGDILLHVLRSHDLAPDAPCGGAGSCGKCTVIVDGTPVRSCTFAVTEDIAQVLLAGAFGSFIRPENACRIGLLPPALEGRIQAVGNAAGSGARRLACNRSELNRAQQIVEKTEFLELASLPGFRRCFAKNMEFQV